MSESTEEKPYGSATGAVSYMRFAALLIETLRRYYGLLLVLLVCFLALGTLLIAIVQPEYTAVAIVGPAPSPLDELSSLAGGLGGSLGAGLTKRLGLGNDSNDMFDQYVQLLTSNRIAGEFAKDANIQQAAFAERYDWDRHRWKSRSGVLQDIKDAVKSFLHFPVKPIPDADDMARFLQKNVTVDAPLTSSFVTISLTSENPVKAQWLLNKLLFDADRIIREDKQRDVQSRINYLARTLPKVLPTDQKESLISILSQQQQSMMMIAADKRYAFVLVDLPHADVKPSSPKLLTLLGAMVLLALGCWGLLIYLLPQDHWLLQWFSRKISLSTLRQGSSRYVMDKI